MKTILDLATLLGGLAAVWFFWQQLSTFRNKRAAEARSKDKYLPREPKIVEKYEQYQAPEHALPASINDAATLRTYLLKDIYNSNLRKRYLELRDSLLETKDRQRVVKSRGVFAVTVGIITWIIFYSLLTITQGALSGVVQVELTSIISWSISGGASATVYGMLHECLEFPPEYDSKGIRKQIIDFGLGALLWAGGIGTLGYLSGLIVGSFDPDNGIIRFIFLMIWLSGYIGGSILSFGPPGSLYQFGEETEHLTKPGPLPHRMYIFCKRTLSLYGFNVYGLDQKVRSSIKASLIVLSAQLILTGISLAVIIVAILWIAQVSN